MSIVLPELPTDLRDRYLDRLGGWSGSRSAEGLEELQRKHLYAVPFHNLALLSNRGRPYSIPSLLEIARDNAMGIGGTCHLTTPAFATLLASVGFQVNLVAGTIREPGDHLLALAHVDGERFVVDVGNGHPYLYPLPVGTSRSWSAHGWSFSWTSRDGRHALVRHRDGRREVVYTVDLAPRAWADFAPIIRAHHEQAGFGPFLHALRAVRLAADSMKVVRNGVYSRHAAGLVCRRPVETVEAVREALQGALGLHPELVEDGVAALLEAHPAALHTDLPQPRVLVATQTIGRVRQLQALVDSLETDRVRSGLSPEQVEVVVLDNQDPTARCTLGLDGRAPFSIHTVPVESPSAAIHRSAGLSPSGAPPLPIGAGRHALVEAVRPRLEASDRPTVVWLLDDDLQLAQLSDGGEGPRETRTRPLLAELLRRWRGRPSLSVAVGLYTGDPPIPAFATWAGQLFDLAANLRAFADAAPNSTWAPPPNRRDTADYYYDHGGGSLLDCPEPFWFEAGRGRLCREALALLAEALPGMLVGCQVFRPVTAEGPQPSRTTSARGGNVAFLDADALFLAPFPSLRCNDGVVTRRADSLAASLLERRGDVLAEVVDLPLLHGRSPLDHSSPTACEHIEPPAVARFMEAQARGIALGRALADGRPVADHLAERRQLHRAGLRRTRVLLERARAALVAKEAWWNRDEPGRASQARIAEVLDCLEAGLPDARHLDEAEGDVGEELQAFLDGLPERAASWSASWA